MDISSDTGASWTTAVAAVVAALVPSVLAFGVWLGTGADPEPAPDQATTSFRLAALRERLDDLGAGTPVEVGDFESVLALHTAAQLDHDECRDDFEETVGAATSTRTPFYFC